MDVFVATLASTGNDNSAADVAVVIDVLRATSVMATAMAADATRIVTCAEVPEARRWKQKFDPTALLCGERFCQRIEGFDLGNSPAEYTSRRVGGRTLILTTTNGTRAIHCVQRAKRIITASFLNLTAVVNSIADAKTVFLACAGTDGHETDEDILLAGAIAQAAVKAYDAKICGDDAARAVRRWDAYQAQGNPLADELRETAGGRNLVRYGFEDDLGRCSKVDSLSVVPEQIMHDPPIFVSRNASL